MAKVIKPIEKCHASMANSLLNGTYILSTIEKRIILLILARINSKAPLEATEWYSLDIEEYARICNVSLKDSYDNIKDAMERLYNRSITDVKGSTKTTFRWIYAKEVDIINRTVRVKWTDIIIPYISELTRQFTRFYIEDIIKIEGIYASRLYELLYQEHWKGLKGTKSILVADLYTLWAIPSGYSTFGELTRSILIPAIKELSRKNLVNVTLEHGRKEGRKVSELLFHYEFIKKDKTLTLGN